MKQPTPSALKGALLLRKFVFQSCKVAMLKIVEDAGADHEQAKADTLALGLGAAGAALPMVEAGVNGASPSLNPVLIALVAGLALLREGERTADEIVAEARTLFALFPEELEQTHVRRRELHNASRGHEAPRTRQ